MIGHFEVYRRLMSYLRPYWKRVVLCYLATLATVGLKLLIPQIVKQAIDNGLAVGESAALYRAGGLILLLAFGMGVVAFGMVYFGYWLSFRVSYDLRNKFFNVVQSLPFSFHDQAQTGDLMSRATSDLRETERFVGIGLRDLIATVALISGVIVSMLIENMSIAVLALIPFPVLIYMAIRFGSIVRPKFKDVQAQMGVLATAMQESMTGIGVVKAFAREPYELKKFDKENEAWFDGRYGIIKIWGAYWPAFTFSLTVSIFFLLWIGGPMAMSGEITIGSLFAMISYVLLLNGPVQRLGFQVDLVSTAGASASRLFEIFDKPNTIPEVPEAIDLDDIHGHITFENVDFAYAEDKPILHNISFNVKPGQTIALMGLTGSGKSTITNLIPRFYDPTAGRITIDGVDVRDVKLKSLRDQIGMVLQEPLLFSATVAENIAYGRPSASFDEIKKAAKVAGADKFISEFADGYKTTVGERGVTLSGGQKQRIAIARALLRNPRILILDDSTSSVDTETEYLIQQGLAELMKNRTTFVIAQRLLTLKNADLILVLDNGRIVERGTHDDLLVNDGLYREIYDLQLKDQEEMRTAEERLALANGQ